MFDKTGSGTSTGSGTHKSTLQGSESGKQNHNEPGCTLVHTVNVKVPPRAMPDIKPSLQKPGISAVSKKLAARKVINGSKQHKITSRLFHAGSEASIEDMVIAATRDGDMERLEALFTQRDHISYVNIDAKDKSTGNTSLILAAKRAHTKIVQFLLNHGADTTLRNYNNQSAVEVASPAIKAILLDHSGKGHNSAEKALLHASWQGNVELVKDLLSNAEHIDPNCLNSDGLTPLMLVCRDLHLFERLSRQLKRPYHPVEVVQELISARGDLHLCDQESRSCLHYAASSKAASAHQVVHLLVHFRANIGLKDRRSFTPLHCACQSGNTEVVTALLAGGSEVNVTGYGGTTPLHITGGNAEVVTVLLAGGSEVNVTGYGGTTPLHITAYNDHESAAQVLLRHGADVNTENHEGFTPLDVAKSRKMKLLLKRAMDAPQVTTDTPQITVETPQVAMETVGMEIPQARESGSDWLCDLQFPDTDSTIAPVLPWKHRILRDLERTERKLSGEGSRSEVRVSSGRLSPNVSENMRRLGQVRSAPRTRKSSTTIDKLPPVVLDRTATPERLPKSASNLDRTTMTEQRLPKSASTVKLQNRDSYNVVAADEHMKYLAALSDQIVAYDNELQENIRKLYDGQERPGSQCQGHKRSRSLVTSMRPKNWHLSDLEGQGSPFRTTGVGVAVPRRLTPLNTGMTSSTLSLSTIDSDSVTESGVFLTQPVTHNTVHTISQDCSPRSPDEDFPELIRFEEVKRSIDLCQQNPTFKTDFLTVENRSNESMILSSGSDNSVESNSVIAQKTLLCNENTQNMLNAKTAQSKFVDNTDNLTSENLESHFHTSNHDDLLQKSKCESEDEILDYDVGDQRQTKVTFCGLDNNDIYNGTYIDDMQTIHSKKYLDNFNLELLNEIHLKRENLNKNKNCGVGNTTVIGTVDRFGDIFMEGENLETSIDEYLDENKNKQLKNSGFDQPNVKIQTSVNKNPLPSESRLDNVNKVSKNVTFENVNNSNVHDHLQSDTQTIVPKTFVVPINDDNRSPCAIREQITLNHPHLLGFEPDVKLKFTKFSSKSMTPQNYSTSKGKDGKNAKELSVKPTRLITSAKKREILSKSDNAPLIKDKNEKKSVKTQVQKSTDITAKTKPKTKSKLATSGESKFKTAWAKTKPDPKLETLPDRKTNLTVLVDSDKTVNIANNAKTKTEITGTNTVTNKVRFNLSRLNQADADLVAKQQTPVIVDPYKDMQQNDRSIKQDTSDKNTRKNTTLINQKKDTSAKRMVSAGRRKITDAKNSDRPISTPNNTRTKGKVIKKKKKKENTDDPDLPTNRSDIALISGDGWHISAQRDASMANDVFDEDHIIYENQEMDVCDADKDNENTVIGSQNAKTNCDMLLEQVNGNIEKFHSNLFSNLAPEQDILSDGTLIFGNAQEQNKDDIIVETKITDIHTNPLSDVKTNSNESNVLKDNNDDENLNEIVEEILGTSSTNNSSMKSLIRRNSSKSSLTDGSGSWLRKLKNSKSLFHAKGNHEELDNLEFKHETSNENSLNKNDTLTDKNNLQDILLNNDGNASNTSTLRGERHSLNSLDDIKNSFNVNTKHTTADTNPDLMKVFYAEDYKFGEKVQAMLNAGANTNRLEAMLAVENKHIEKIMHSFRRIELQTNKRGLIMYDNTNMQHDPLQPEVSAKKNEMMSSQKSQKQEVMSPTKQEVSSVKSDKFQEMKQDGAMPNQQDDKISDDGSRKAGSVDRSTSYHCQGMSRSDSVSSSCSNKSTDDIIQWTKGNVLGRGAFGTVYCGLTSYGEMIAVKQIELNTSAREKANTEYEKIQEEVGLLKTLTHNNIVGYLGTSFVEGVVSIYMQFIPGGSIASILARFGPLSESVFCRYTKQILEGVQYLHGNDVIHRDIKGGNVMLMPTGVIKLIDFGCAKRLCINMSMSQSQILRSMKGTPYWMAPEIVNETGHGKKSDIWSIGCTVFEMATGKPPWSGMNPIAAIFAIGTDKPVPELPETFTKHAHGFVSDCLNRDQNMRPSASDLLRHPFIHRRKSSNR